MKNLGLIFILILSSSIWAQDNISEQLRKRREQAISSSPQFVSNKPSSSVPQINTNEGGVEDLTCRDKQSSIPLSFFSNLLINNGENYQMTYDKDKKSMRIDFGEMMTACNDKFNFVKRSAGEKYYIELKLKNGVSFEDFQKCTLEKTENEYKTERVVINFNEVKPDQEIVFLSNGPYASKYPRHKMIKIEGCQMIEQFDNYRIVALEKDSDYINKQDQVAKICESNDYKEILSNINQFEDFGGVLQKVAAGLIDEKVKEAASKILDKKLDQVDFDVFDDFEKYVLDPKIEEIERVYSELMLLEVNSSAYDKKKRELDKLKRELAKYSRAPYPDNKVRSILLADGYFSEEALIFKINTKVATTRMIFNKQDDVVIDPARAEDILDTQVADHNAFLDQSRKEFRIRKGEITGESQKYFEIAESFEQQLEDETQGYQEGMALLNRKKQECAREAMTFFGYNAKKHQECVESKDRFMNEFTKIYQANREGLQKEINEYLKQGNHYYALEAEARGEVPKKTDKVVPSDNTPKYSFNYGEAYAQAFPQQQNQGQNPQLTQQQMQWYQQQQQMRVPPQYQNLAQNNWNPQMSMQQYAMQNPGWRGGMLSTPGLNYQQNGSFMNQGFNQMPGVYSFNYGNNARMPANNLAYQYQQNPLYNPQMNGNYYYQNYHQFNQSIPSQMYNGPRQPAFSTPGFNPNPGMLNPYHGLGPNYNNMIRN